MFRMARLHRRGDLYGGERTRYREGCEPRGLAS